MRKGTGAWQCAARGRTSRSGPAFSTHGPDHPDASFSDYIWKHRFSGIVVEIGFRIDCGNAIASAELFERLQSVYLALKKNHQKSL